MVVFDREHKCTKGLFKDTAQIPRQNVQTVLLVNLPPKEDQVLELKIIQPFFFLPQTLYPDQDEQSSLEPLKAVNYIGRTATYNG